MLIKIAMRQSKIKVTQTEKISYKLRANQGKTYLKNYLTEMLNIKANLATMLAIYNQVKN